MHCKRVSAVQLPELKFFSEPGEKKGAEQRNIQCFQKTNPFTVVYLFGFYLFTFCQVVSIFINLAKKETLLEF